MSKAISRWQKNIPETNFPVSDKNRFYNYVCLPDENGCMNWKASRRDFGYGAFSLYKGKSIKAHRFSWMIFNGDIPKGMHVLHHCDNPTCIAPNHLYLGTDKENARDRIKRNRHSPPPIRCGEKNNKSVLTANQIIEIIKLINDGDLNNSQIANLYHVTSRNIDFIQDEKTWKNLTKNKITRKRILK